MAAGFVIKTFYRNGSSEYFMDLLEDHPMYSSNICMSFVFDEYEGAEKMINKLLSINALGIYQIEKIHY